MKDLLNSPFWEKINDAVDFMLVNVLFILCCLPIFTVGASISALYAASFRYMEYQETGAGVFLKAFRENFKGATPAWLALLGIGLFLAFDIYLIFNVTIPAYWLVLVVICLLLVAYVMVLCNLFLVQARFVCTFRQLFTNALLIALAHPVKTLLIAILWGLPLLIFAVDPYVFAAVSPLFLLIYFSATGYLSARLMKKPFAAYAEKV